MEDKIKVIFLNELDLKIFDEMFYSHLLKNVVSLTKKEVQKTDNECKTCACLEQVKEKSFSSEV